MHVCTIHNHYINPGNTKWESLADPGIYFFGGQTKIPNRKLSAKPESKARSAREVRAKPKKKRGRGFGRGLGEPLPRTCLKNQS